MDLTKQRFIVTDFLIAVSLGFAVRFFIMRLPVALFSVALFILSQLFFGCANAPSAPVVDSSKSVESQLLSIIPAQIDCGAVSQCEMPPTISMVLRNTTIEPIRIRGFVATCGCTIPDLQPNTVIAPSQEIKVNVRLELWGQGRKQQFIRFIDENSQPLGRVQVRYEVRSSLRSSPSGISREVNPEGTFQIESLTDEFFTIGKSYPAVVVQRESQAAADHSLLINWQEVDALATAANPIPEFAFDSAGKWSTLMVRIETDYPECSEVFIWLRNITPERAVTH